MDDTERRGLIAEFIKRVMLGVDLLLVDDENLSFLERHIEEATQTLSIGYSFPFQDYSKLEAVRMNNELLEKIADLCRAKQNYNAAREALKAGTLDDTVMKALGLWP